MIVQRPSYKELTKKLAEAKEAISKGEVIFANPEKVLGELSRLHLSAQDVWSLISELLEEIGPYDYAGTRPPQRSYERDIEGRELFAFAWDSRRMKKRM